jgi:uncharacterized membrane protein
VHGLLSYRLRDLLAFAAITLVVSNLFENMSVLTGFPFGRYVYTDTLGPKVFLVPALIGPAYWLLTTFVFLQLFALYLRWQQSLPTTHGHPSKAQSLQAILFYGLIPAGYTLNSLTRATTATVADPAGVI